MEGLRQQRITDKKTGVRQQTALFWCQLQGAAHVAGSNGRGFIKEGGAQRPYLARSLLVGGGVGEGDAENSPGCSGMRASVGGTGGSMPGGMEEVLRVEGEPLRDTQEVSITLTPMLQWDRDAQPIKSREDVW